ncbi:hypothetical protein NA56DRAFT_708255 [Hyaloscypha hepaticicola]|uniref:RING-type domain-containing protein n=1 Tax=Hyaloscypha hepaticicola TaxID=2082293 RepID=A0A2J6PSM7_9HELO|nr:hypothetical protein NA56DRAFT_708255 [Hyaloscypha hepaticicola]
MPSQQQQQQQQQQQSKQKRDPSASPSSSLATDESGRNYPKKKRAKSSNNKNDNDDQVPSCGCSNWHDQHEQERAETERECYICLEEFYNQKWEGIITACGHVFCAECWRYWVEWLQALWLEVRCPECRGHVESIDPW